MWSGGGSSEGFFLSQKLSSHAVLLAAEGSCSGVREMSRHALKVEQSLFRGSGGHPLSHLTVLGNLQYHYTVSVGNIYYHTYIIYYHYTVTVGNIIILLCKFIAKELFATPSAKFYLQKSVVFFLTKYTQKLPHVCVC